MNILHVIEDNKFYNEIINVFDCTHHKCEYVCVVDDECENFRIIKSDRIKLIHKSECNQLWSNNDIDIYMFHPLSGGTDDWVLSIPKQKKIIASSWGYDLYCSQNGLPPLLDIRIYGDETSKIIKDINKPNVLRRLRRVLGKIYYCKRNRERKKERQIEVHTQKQVLERIDYWATVLPIEYEMLKHECCIGAERFPFQYSNRSLSDVYEKIDFETTNYILLGNSADPSNNHLDLIKLLQERGIIDSYSLYIPLAYGDERYKNWLKTYLESKTDKFIVQDELIPINEYRKVLKSCRVAVFGHLRQQALGNIIENMLQGKKVFLYKDSMAYKYFIDRGAIVYNIEQDLCLKEINSQLTEEQIDINKKACDEFTIENVVSAVESALNGFKRNL